ncbi:MAG: hypothetical protein C7B45_05335 [Sulfobacillus acidophilus]|uniref:Uncharacterized protein n=1 Tax=Sulfobacillus acidophilus TaxID=53633 RepID=A0A2T2WKI8_9FIRM|nr:MAG: hypothetical protein C7B45_05335 [Sulfobacillus acidophilus]
MVVVEPPRSEILANPPWFMRRIGSTPFEVASGYPNPSIGGIQSLLRLRVPRENGAETRDLWRPGCGVSVSSPNLRPLYRSQITRIALVNRCAAATLFGCSDRIGPGVVAPWHRVRRTRQR